MVTEQEARDMDIAIKAFEDKDAQARKDQNVIDLAVAQVWYDTTIEPTLTWNNTQPDTTQLRNTIADRATLEALRPTDRHRQEVLRLEIRKHDERIRTIKARL